MLKGINTKQQESGKGIVDDSNYVNGYSLLVKDKKSFIQLV